MQRIIYSMNNNVVLAQNDQGEEVMLVGSGIGFNKRKGAIVEESRIEKVFQLRTEESKENFITLLKDVPLDFITVTYDVIDNLSKKYSYPVQEYIYVTLTDHIYCSYQAIMKGNYQENELTDISDQYQVEYKMAEEALAVFKSKLLDAFPDDELGRIALHFINAKGVTTLESTGKIKKTKDILNLVEAELKRNGIKRTSKNSNFYDRFMIHLNYFLDYLDRNKDDSKSLLEMEEHIKLTYPEAYKIGSAIYDIIACETGIDLYQSERVYLVIHIQRLL